MAKIIVYDSYANEMQIFYKEEDEPMPYNEGGSLLVQEFRGSSNSFTMWTTREVMEAWNRQREIWGSPINVGFAFKRPWEGGHSDQSQHYAGTAFDVAQGWTNARRAELRTSAIESGLWSYVEPVSISPTWVHFDQRESPPACATGGYPILTEGSLSNYVLILQDGLNTLGYATGGLDGAFGYATFNAVQNYQSSKNLTADGVVGCETWRALQSDVVGNGRTSSTLE